MTYVAVIVEYTQLIGESQHSVFIQTVLQVSLLQNLIQDNVVLRHIHILDARNHIDGHKYKMKRKKLKWVQCKYFYPLWLLSEEKNSIPLFYKSSTYKYCTVQKTSVTDISFMSSALFSQYKKCFRTLPFQKKRLHLKGMKGMSVKKATLYIRDRSSDEINK